MAIETDAVMIPFAVAPSASDSGGWRGSAVEEYWAEGLDPGRNCGDCKWSLLIFPPEFDVGPPLGVGRFARR